VLEVGRRLFRFPGGLKLEHHKSESVAEPLARLPLPERLYLPLVQHQGPAGELLVEPGQSVLKGQPLSRARSDREVPIHAPSSGRIAELRCWPVSWPPGSEADCLVLETDGEERWIEPDERPEWATIEPAELIDSLRAGGLAGLGGAMFPTAAKLRGDWEAPRIHTLILNGSECEPWISCDETLMRGRPGAVIEGGLILARALGAEEVVIGIEDQMGGMGRALEQAAAEIDADGQVRVVRVARIYPEGGERQLIQVLTGAEVPHDGLPQDLGLACLNVATAASARDIVVEGRPLIERIVTVTGPAITRPRNVIAPLGAPIAALIDFAGGLKGPLDRLVLGGPMSGLPLASDRIPVIKGSNCVLALGPGDVARRQPEMPCINCGECVRVCPASLLPQMLFHAARAEDHDEATALHLFDCIECGCCAQVCPSHIPLVDWYRHEKGVLRERGQEEARARRARERFEARERRLAEREADRQRKREAREQLLKQQAAAKSEVQAAIERVRDRISAPDDGPGDESK
jgi:electron transport complex protein RnfC